MATLDAVKNFAKVTVSIGYNDTAVTINLTAGHGAKLPDPSSDGEFNLVWWDVTTYEDPSDDPNVEIVRCTARTTDQLTITRAQEGTSGTIKNTTGKTYKMILAPTAKLITDIKSEIGTEIRNETPTGTINGTNDTFTLANIPDPALELDIRLAGMFMTQNEDYTLSGLTITFINAPIVGPMRAFYKY